MTVKHQRYSFISLIRRVLVVVFSYQIYQHIFVLFSIVTNYLFLNISNLDFSLLLLLVILSTIYSNWSLNYRPTFIVIYHYSKCKSP